MSPVKGRSPAEESRPDPPEGASERQAETIGDRNPAASKDSSPDQAPAKAGEENGSTDGHQTDPPGGHGANGNGVEKSAAAVEPDSAAKQPVEISSQAADVSLAAEDDHQQAAEPESQEEDSPKTSENGKPNTSDAGGAADTGGQDVASAAISQPAASVDEEADGEVAAAGFAADSTPLPPAEGGKGADTPCPVAGNGAGDEQIPKEDDGAAPVASNGLGEAAKAEVDQKLTDAENGGKPTAAEEDQRSSEAENGSQPEPAIDPIPPASSTDHEPLESGSDQAPLEPVVSAPATADSENPATAPVEVGDDATSDEPSQPATEERRRSDIGPPLGPDSEPTRRRSSARGPPLGPDTESERTQPQASTSGRNGMTDTRSLWVVGSEEHLPDAGAAGGDEGGSAASSWGTINSTFRAIRGFKRGVSKRLRRPPSHEQQQSAPHVTRSFDRQSSHQVAARGSAERQLSHASGYSRPSEAAPDLQFRAADEAQVATPSAETSETHSGGGFFRTLSFRRSASWRGPLRRDRSFTGSVRHRSRDQQPGGAGAGGLDAAMQGAAAVPLQSHVERHGFATACAAYEPPSRTTGPAADENLRDKKEAQLKEDLRNGYWPLDHPIRHQLWQNICELHGATMGQTEEYESTVRQLEGDYGPARAGQHQMPPFVHSFYMNHFLLSESGVWAAERVLAVLYYNNPTITYAPSLYPICCLLLHYMDEADAYNALSMMLRNKKQGYLVQTKRDYEISWKILIKLCRKHTKNSLHYLHQQAQPGENVEHVLADWLAWMFVFLPFAHAVRLMDCYLMEGEKVLYRGAMALVILIHKMASRQLGEWATSFQDNTVQDVMETFCRDIQVSPEKLLKTLFNIRGFSRDSLATSYARVKAQIKAGGGRLSFPERRCARAVSKQQSHPGMGMPSVLSQDELAEASSTIGVKEHSAKFPQLKDPELALMSFEELLRLWENLPPRFALYTPLLLYTSDEHGFSLKTFFQKVATFEPTVLLLRTTGGSVFGAYCSATWNTRNQLQEDGSRHTYFGTGETFLFTLRPQLKVYPWVGKVKQAEDPSLAGVSHSEQLFMAANNTMLTIGGGGGQAIWLDENLSRGKTDACETFGNPPLTSSGSFDVACMEAFGFAPA